MKVLSVRVLTSRSREMVCAHANRPMETNHMIYIDFSYSAASCRQPSCRVLGFLGPRDQAGKVRPARASKAPRRQSMILKPCRWRSARTIHRSPRQQRRRRRSEPSLAESSRAFAQKSPVESTWARGRHERYLGKKRQSAGSASSSAMRRISMAKKGITPAKTSAMRTP